VPRCTEKKKMEVADSWKPGYEGWFAGEQPKEKGEWANTSIKRPTDGMGSGKKKTAGEILDISRLSRPSKIGKKRERELTSREGEDLMFHTQLYYQFGALKDANGTVDEGKR